MTEEIDISEKELIRRAKHGDDKAFEEIINLYQNKICSTIYFMMKDDNKVEDIAQEVFIKVYKNINRFNEQSSLYTWIYRITMNACYDELKKDSKIVYFSSLVKDDDKEIEFEDYSQNIDDQVSKKFEKDALIKAIKSLQSEQKALIILRDIRGFSYNEIADMLNLKLGTVKSKINRARISLKEVLEKQGFNYEV